MKKVGFLAMLMFLITGAISGCDYTTIDSDSITGSGDVVTIEKDFTDFSAFSLCGTSVRFTWTLDIRML